MDPKRKLSDAADPLSEETIARRRSRRVSFAETTAVHVFERDESTESPHETSSDSGGKSTGGKSAGSESSDDDDGPPMKFIMDREDFSPGSASNASVASNDDDNFFGPVSMKFLKSGRFSDSGISEDNNDNINNNHEITLDSTQFSLHFKNIGTDISATSTSNLMTPTGTATPASTVSNIEPNRAKKTNSDIKSSEGLGDFSLVAETEMIDFGKLSPSLGKLIQGVEALRKPNFQEKHQENENEIILHTPKGPLSNSKSSPGSIHSLREKRAKLFGDLSLTNNPSIDSEFMKHGKIISEINDSIVKNTPKSKLGSNSAGLDFKKAFSAIKDSVGKKTSVVKEISISTRLNFENENEGEKSNLNFENEDEGEKLNLNFEKKNENVDSDLNFENVNENVVSNLNFENWNENVVVNLNFDNENENVVSNCPKELSLKAKKAQIDHKLDREHARRRQIEQENLEREDHATERQMEESLEREDHARKRQIEQNLEREDHARKRQIEKNLEREEHAGDRQIDRNLERENHPRNGQTEQNLEREPARKCQLEPNLEREEPARKQQTEQNLEREKLAKKLHARKRQIDQSSERENHARKGQIKQNVERDHAGEHQIEQNVEREDHARKRQIEQNVERANNARKRQIEQNLETEEPSRKHIRIEKSPNCRVESPSFDWREVVSNLSDMSKQIFSLSFKKLSLNELDLLLSILEKQQTASKDASVSAFVKARNSRDTYQERLAEATLLHDNHLYDKAMLELTQLKIIKLKGLISKLGQMNHQLSFYKARIEKLRQPIDDCLTSSSNNVPQEEQDKLKEKRQALEKLEQNLKNLCTSIQVRCKLPNNLSCDETIKIAKENLKERKLCRSFHQAIWPWVPTLNKDNNNKEEIVLKYYDFLFQRFTMGTSNSSDILVTDTLNETKIEETFKGMNAYSAFDFVFKDKKRNFKHIWQATMETGLVLSNLINVLNEVMRAKVELLNLNYVNFNSNETSSKLELQMVFMSFKRGKNLAVSLDMTDLKSVVYPDSSELRAVMDQSATTIDEAILTNIMSKIQNLESGPEIILRLCKTVSQLVHSSSV